MFLWRYLSHFKSIFYSHSGFGRLCRLLSVADDQNFRECVPFQSSRFWVEVMFSRFWFTTLEQRWKTTAWVGVEFGCTKIVFLRATTFCAKITILRALLFPSSLETGLRSSPGLSMRQVACRQYLLERNRHWFTEISFHTFPNSSTTVSSFFVEV